MNSDGTIGHRFCIKGTGSEVALEARDIRRERSGVHATVIIAHNNITLGWTRCNIERDEDRTRLSNAAWKHAPPEDQKAFPAGRLKHVLDLFAADLWPQHVQAIAGELMEGDPDIGPPKRLLGPYILEGAGTIIYAPPGRGKSYLALSMAVSLDAGVDEVWPVPEARRAMYINLERSRESKRHRLARVNRALGLDPRRRLAFMNARGRPLSDVAEGIAASIKHHGVKVLFLDSISRAGLGDLTDATVANKIVDLLNGLCTTWVAIAHTPRQDESHVFGSVHFEAGEDLGIRLLSQPGERVSGVGLEVTKANDLPKPPLTCYALEWGEDGLEVIRPARRHEFSEIEAGRRMSLADEVMDYLAQGEASPTEIATALGRNRQSVSTLLNRDRRFVHVRREGRVAYFGLRTTDDDDAPISNAGDR